MDGMLTSLKVILDTDDLVIVLAAFEPLRASRQSNDSGDLLHPLVTQVLGRDLQAQSINSYTPRVRT